MTEFRSTLLVVTISIHAALAAGCSDKCSRDLGYNPEIDPANFVNGVNNRFFPLVPGTTFTYEAGDETVDTTVTTERKLILGVSCVVVHDTASFNGEVIEDTFDYYAQDRLGNVWYMGEATEELDHGVVTSTHGSWEAGVDGAKPGIIMPASPQAGLEYSQEYLACEAEDRASVIATDAAASVPEGDYTGCVKTRDFTPLEPALNEEKFYCPGKGLVLSVDKVTGDREELTAITH